jgi:hypothetical protein
VVTDQQIRLYKKERRAGRSQETAAAMAGMTANSARKWEDLPLPSIIGTPRDWRTRVDPLADVWDIVAVPLLQADSAQKLQGTTILEALKEKDPDRYGDGLLRTVQRRVHEWRAMYGPGKEVFFEQVHPPGREAQFDFTHCDELDVTLLGTPFPHMFFELVLSHSGWRLAQLCFGETIEALIQGFQDGVYELGGLMEVARSDNMSAATQELRSEAGRKPTRRFQAVLDHLSLEYTRIRAGKSNENGVVERAHQTFKSALYQALIVRGSRDFISVDAYKAFAEGVRQRLNGRVEQAFQEERKHLRPLPAVRLPAYTDIEVCVRKWSTIRVRENTYSVPSRLIGERVVARVYADVIEVIYRGVVLERMPRLRGRGQHRIDYRHIVRSLVRKPGAFARWRYREELFPSQVFRHAYDSLRESRGERADVEYLRVLELAADEMESRVEAALQQLLAEGRRVDATELRALMTAPAPRPAPVEIAVVRPDLTMFDNLLTGECRARCERHDDLTVAV